jgi:hypothetical protein
MFNPSTSSHPAVSQRSPFLSASILIAEAAIATLALSIFASASPNLFGAKPAHPAQPVPVVNIQLPAYPAS